MTLTQAFSERGYVKGLLTNFGPRSSPAAFLRSFAPDGGLKWAAATKRGDRFPADHA